MDSSDDEAIREGEPPIISRQTRSGSVEPSAPKVQWRLSWLWQLVIMMTAIQVCITARIAFGTIGFDHPGTSGLDYPQAIGLGITYTIAFFIGGVAALVIRAWLSAGLQVTVAVALVAWLSIR